MNLYILDHDPFKAATYLNDHHVRKMTTDVAQMLSTISIELGGTGPYRSRRRCHPCVAWASATEGNWVWLYTHFIALLDEHYLRFGKAHSAAIHALALWSGAKPTGGGHMLPFAQCMPDELQGPDAVVAYRRYYLDRKQHLATWTRRPVPWWWNQGAGDERTI